jgi:predicted O-methyltransferase YrrM
MGVDFVRTVLRRIVAPQFHPEVYLRSLVRERTGMVVSAGAFAGLVFPKDMERAGLAPKLLGTYERELAAVVEEIIADGFDSIVNVGAADGYYAIGLARRLPKASVYAFETDESVRTLLAKTVAANRVSDRVVVRGKCEPDDLRQCLPDTGRTLVVCDVEGYEAVLLDADLVPQLKHSYILVELHELRCPGITLLLLDRFRASHIAEHIQEQPRSAQEYPFRTLYTRLLPDRFLLNAINEWRSEQQTWLWMRPR